MKKIKLLLIALIAFVGILAFSEAKVPSFDDNFAGYLTNEEQIDDRGTETVFDICIDRNISLMANVRNLFYPNFINPQSECGSSRGGLIWDIIRVVGFIVLFIYIVMAGINLLFNGDKEDEVGKVGKSFLFLLYGAFLIFGATWLLGTVLNIENLTGSGALTERLQGGPDSLFFQLLSFFKIVAFFVAILMIVFYGFKIMSSMDQEDKIKTAQKGILNILMALFLIKIIDYVFYIAQAPEFAEKATDLIIQIAKLLMYLLGAIFVVFIFYAGFLLLTSGGNEDNMKKVKNIFMTIVLSSFAIFLFLLIAYQIFNEFA